MKKLNKQEADEIIPMGRGRSTLVSAMVKQLPVGEGIEIEKKDWVTKTPPYRVIKYVGKITGRTFRYGKLPNGSYFAQRLS